MDGLPDPYGPAGTGRGFVEGLGQFRPVWHRDRRSAAQTPMRTTAVVRRAFRILLGRCKCSRLQYISIHTKRAIMAITKSATLTLRIDPTLKAALRDAAQLEHRSIANMVEVLIRDHCARNGIAIVGGERSASHPGESRRGRQDTTRPQDIKKEKGKPS